jgi:hypothetical protein
VNQSTVTTACWSKHLDLLWSAVAAGVEESVPLQVSSFSGRPWWRGRRGDAVCCTSASTRRS